MNLDMEFITSLKVIDESKSHGQKRKSSLSRLKAQGYSEEDVKTFRYATSHYTDTNDRMKTLPCKCTSQYRCERCTILKLREQFGGKI